MSTRAAREPSAAGDAGYVYVVVFVPQEPRAQPCGMVALDAVSRDAFGTRFGPSVESALASAGERDANDAMSSAPRSSATCLGLLETNRTIDPSSHSFEARGFPLRGPDS